jgi:hypothetical protein
MRKLINIIVLTICFVLSCTKVAIFEIGINTIGDDKAIPVKLYLLIPTTQITSDQLQYEEIKKYIVTVMTERGYKITNNQKKATLAIIVDYGISAPKQNEFSYNAPVFGQTGYSSSNTTGTMSGSGNTATINSSTQYMPQYGITGYKTVQGSYTTYTRYLKLVAYDFKRFLATKKEKQVWYSVGVSTGSSEDLRLVIPYIIVALKPYIGKNSGKIININLPENSEETKALINQSK